MIPLLALLLDLALGEPRNRFHPVAWLGKLLALGFRAPPAAGPPRLVLQGAADVAGATALVTLAARSIERLARRHGVAGVLAQVVMLKYAFSLRRLLEATTAVGQALERGDLCGARALAGRDLVSRDTSSLDAGEVASAAIESVAENLTDSLVAPLLYYVLAGMPGAWAYRVINTADAMVGYRTGRLEHLGKIAARLDDAVNLLPARLAALTLVATARLVGADGAHARAVMRRDHSMPASPNAGWTMSAMAGALGVTLAKRGAYRLGEGPLPGAPDVARAVRVASAASALVACAVVGAALVTGATSLLAGATSLLARRRAFSSA